MKLTYANHGFMDACLAFLSQRSALIRLCGATALQTAIERVFSQRIAMILTHTKDVLMNACGAVPNKRSASLIMKWVNYTEKRCRGKPLAGTFGLGQKARRGRSSRA